MTKTILSSLVFLTLIMTSHGQWTQTEGPYGRVIIYDLEKVNNQLFASTRKGLFTKADGDPTWQRIFIRCGQYLNRTGDTIISNDDQSLAFIDAGSSSQQLISFANTSYPLNNRPDLAYKDSLLFVCSHKGIYVSNNFGTSHTPFLNGMDMDTTYQGTTPSYMLLVREVIATQDYLYCATANGVYRSDYSLTQWERKTTIYTRQIYEGQTALYAITNDSLYRSTDKGNTWTAIYGQKPISVCEHNNAIYTTTGVGIKVSTNNGLSWSNFNNGLATNNISRVENLEGSLHCVENFENIYKWNGTSWVSELHKGLINTYLRGVETSNQNVFVLDVEKGVFRYNSSNTWSNVSPHTPGISLLFNDLRAYNDTLYTLVDAMDTATFQRSLELCYSPDGGQSWTCGPGPASSGMNLTYGLFKIFDGTFYFYVDQFVLRSDNLNGPWEDISPLSSCSDYIYDLLYFNGSVYLSGCESHNLKRYHENSQTWVTEYLNVNTGGGTNLLMPLDTFLYVNTLDGFYKRSLNSTSYTKLGSLDTTGLRASDYLNIGKSIYVTAGTGLYRSTDNGLTWSSIMANLPENWGTVDVGAYNDTLFLALYDYGVFKHPLLQDPISISENDISRNSVSIFPNPAKDWITVTLAQDETSTSFSVSDQSGKLLLFGELEESGKINTSSLAKGNYVLSLQTSSGVKSTKLIIAE